MTLIFSIRTLDLPEVEQAKNTILKRIQSAIDVQISNTKYITSARHRSELFK